LAGNLFGVAPGLLPDQLQQSIAIALGLFGCAEEAID
jgi:hypothetical protein